MRLRLLSLLVLALAGCDQSPRVPPPSAPAAVLYEARGVLQKIDAAGRRAVIAHEAIPGYMEAMTMEFDVPDAPLPAGLEPGDVVTFRLSVTATHGWIESLRKVGHVALAPEPPRAAQRPALEPGAALPDCALVDERGQRFTVADYRGHAFAFTFFYTRCPFPDFCPLLANRFAEVQRSLSAGDAGGLLSITLDPAHDTPAVLAAYARKVRAEDGRWRFATGEAAEIEKLSAQFGLAVVREGAVLNHNLRTVVVDAQGRVQKIFTGNQWTAKELSAELRRHPLE